MIIDENKINNELVNNSDTKTVNILWTGGWDSTFRLVELSRMDININPVYVLDPNRPSRKREEQAMEQIIQALKSKDETKATFLPIKIIKLDDIPKNEEISNAYKIINKETSLGSQHEWLARLGNIYPGMEMGTEAGTPETSHIICAIQKFCNLKIVDGVGIITPEKTSKEGMLVLGWFKFPIIEKTETEMAKLIKEWGYEDVMSLIWFCHTPIKGKPCGFCHPCHVKIESSMEWLLPRKALNNYKKYKKLEKILGTKNANRCVKLLRHFYK